jgi:DNA-binding CsgD family transcriptional regulator
MGDGMKKVLGDKRALAERMKELNCLYEISRLFSHRSYDLARLLREVMRVIPGAWQYPDRTCVRICHAGREYRSKNYSPNSACLTEAIEPKKHPGGFVEVGYLREGPGASRPSFLEDEKRLLKAIAELLGNILEKKQAEIALRQTTFELKNKNIALKEIISQIELERKALQDQLRMNIELTVLPLLSKLQNQEIPQDAWDVYLKIIRQNLEDVTSSLTRKVIEDRLSLSPREFELCNLIKNGLPNKKIAELMRISLLTVERHRHNIRKKLHIDNEKVNLSTFLRAL